MNDSKRKLRGPTPPTSPVKQTFIDGEGISKVVLLPPGETDVRTGIPVSLDVSPLYEHMPPGFNRALHEALHAQGLIEPADYFKTGAADRFKAAMLTVIRHDFLSVQALAKQEMTDA